MSRVNMDHVVAFRIPSAMREEIAKIRKANNIAGVNSDNKLVRKVLIDFVEGRLTYTDPDDVTRPPSV